MHRRLWIWMLACLLCLAGAWLLWPRAVNTRTKPSALQKVAAPTVATVSSASAVSKMLIPVYTNSPKAGTVFAGTNKFAFRLENTRKTIGQLTGDRHAILLENALIDTGSPLTFSIPAHLRSQGDPGAYIVQARGAVDNAFRAMLASAGATIVSYIPNDAFLVRITQDCVEGLAANPLTQAVTPYEPYYKIQSSLLIPAIGQMDLPEGAALNLGLFADTAGQTIQEIEKLGGTILAQDRSPFGPMVRVQPPQNWTVLATLPGVQIVEGYHPRVHANDLSRLATGVSVDTLTSSNYLNLSGSNVMVEVNDSGIDATHPDFQTGSGLPIRVFGALTSDIDGHGTHVAGIIAGNGLESTTVTNVPGSFITTTPGPTATNFQFRGKAPLANLLAMNWNASDQTLQEAAARTNALISNNSWNYGDSGYDLAAASYDAAVRDALPLVTGSQPVTFVFSAGNDGSGDDSSDPGGGIADSILSPATAKNVITVGAIQEFRDITNIVTTITPDGATNTGTPWQPETSTSYRVAGFSARGNVGIGTEGTFGRYKPDVVAPGTFVVSTRSSQWDITNYFYIDPTNYDIQTYFGIIVQPDSLWANGFPIVPNNVVGVSIEIDPNADSPEPFPNLPIYVGLYSSSGYDFFSTNDPVIIPGDPNAPAGYLQSILNTEGFWGFNYGISNSTTEPISFDLTTDLITTNNPGDYFLVLSNLNQAIGTANPNSTGPGPYYRYETGTSMSAADVSGVLALIGDYFTNTLQSTPSPALLKAILINGARVTGFYNFHVQNSINYEGWGLVNLSDSLPPGITNVINATGESMLILDQSPTNALATGDSHTFTVQVSNPLATALPLRITLAWTDPPGNPAAAIKLVNDLNLVVTNLSNSTNPVVYYGNDIPASSVYNTTESVTNPPVFDSINNVENVYLPLGAGTNFSITVLGYRVNVNAVTAQTNNVVQDYALVISSGEGEVTNALTVTDGGIVSTPTGGQQITFVMTTNAPLLNQIVGASSPLLGTNNLPVGTNTTWGSNGVVTLGMTNQWHFYVVTNTGAGADFTNAAFITFIPSTLAIPRMGVFADSTADATRPSADIDLYVAGPNDPNASGLLNLDPTVISNCLAGANGDAASLSRGGTEFVVYTNSVSIAANSGAPSVYYVGVYSEDREAVEYGFIPIFTDIPFSQPGPNGSQIVNGLNVPVNIPDGSPAHPGVGYVFAIELFPMEVGRVVVTNIVTHQNFGDLIGTLAHGDSSGASQSIVLNNHDSLFNPLEIYTHIYDDSGQGDIVGSQPSDGPGSLNSFLGQQGVGLWMLTEVDDSLTQTGSMTGFNLLIEPHQDLTKEIIVTLGAGTWFYDFIDVPAGYTNLSIFATNLPPTSVPALQLYLNYDVQPDFLNYLESVWLTNGVPPGNSISYGPPLLPGRYFVGLFNPDNVSHDVELLATLSGAASAIVPGDYTTNNGPGLRDDAVSSSTIFISSTQQIASVNVGFVVNHSRISDLTFTLVSPAGQRVLLMENRGGTTTNGAGDVFITTNTFAPVTASGGGTPQTNYLNVGQTSGSLTINYDMFQVPDQMTVYYGTNSSSFTLPNALLNITVSYTGTATVNFGPGTSTYLTVIMNQFGNPAGANGTAWIYTAGGVETNYNYLAFTEDTNLATIPIKFAIPPYDLADFGTNYILSDFELASNGDYLAPTNIFDAFGGWNLTNRILVGTNLVTLTNNEVSVITDPANAAGGSNLLALAGGTIFRQVPMTPGRQFSLTFMYRGPGIAGWWRGEGNATDSSDPENYGNNGELIGRFNFPAGEAGQAFQFEDAGSEFQFAGTNTYVQIRQRPFLMLANTNGGTDTNLFLVQSTSLDVGPGSGFTIEGWINPTNASRPQPLVEWLARVPTNGSDTNLVIEAGPFLNRATGHYYYLLGSTNWTTSEFWATQLGGHLATIETANEENWVYDTFAQYGGTNRNLWIGLTNDVLGHFAWSSGLTNVFYTNWVAGEPVKCTVNDFYTAILGPTNAFPGLWVLENNSGTNNNGVICGVSPTNRIYGVVEVEEIQTNGVQLWISVTVTNDINSSNSCLYANLVDTTNGSHIIYSASGLVRSNVYQHVALTYSTNSGLAALYYNGTNVATTNLGVFTPKTTGDVLLGRDMSRATNNYYGGKMDEMSIYGRCLSASEIAAIYNVSALTTNRNTGKFDPSITPALSLAEARVSLGGLTNIILGANNRWQSQSFSFTATTNSLPLQITGLEPGMLLDSFNVAEAPLGNLYYLPEQSLDSLIGTSAHGTWTLEIWDNRAGAFITSSDQLLSWQLQIVLQTNSLPGVALDPETPTTITVPPDQIVYLTVDVPSWANFATNILVSATAPVDLLFNQTNPPTGVTFPNYPLLTASTGGIGSPVLAVNPPSTPPLLPGQTYYLGVRNTNAHAVTAVVQVDYDITALSNGVPVTGVLNTTNLARYFVFNVSSNAYEATFQLLQLSGNADLVVRKGTPLPTLLSSDYGSFNAANADENIYVFTNSSPVALSPGLWYLGVFKRDSGPVTYAVLAKELDLQLVPPVPNIIDLTNGVPFDFTAGPGAALTNFFRFTVTNAPPAIHFELYNLSGNGDLTVQTNAPPFGPPFFQTSQQSGLDSELIFIATNSALSSLTNSALTNLNAQWYLGVPNRETNLITYTIVAVLDTNGYLPAFPGATGAGGGAVGGGRVGNNGTVYHVYNLEDSGPGSLRDAVSDTNRTVVFDVSGTINLSSPLVITNSYLTLAGQTAPGGGITVAGQMTTVQFAHDVIIRDLRFRPAGVTTAGVAWSNGFEGAARDYVSRGNPTFDSWTVTSNQVTVISNSVLANMGTNLLALASGVISNTLPTVAGQTYTLSFAYRGPGAISLWRGEGDTVDPISGNNGTPVNDLSYAAGEVNSAFSMGTAGYVFVPASPSLDIGPGPGFTIDAWIDPTAISASAPTPIIEWSQAGGVYSGQSFFVSSAFLDSPGCLFGGFVASNNVMVGNAVISAPNIVAMNVFQHVALTYNRQTGGSAIYLNGVMVASTNNVGSFVPWTTGNVLIGRRINIMTPSQNFHFPGKEDEISIYGRDLSASEIKAIYQKGGLGKYDISAPSIASGLAEAQVNIGGTNSPVFFGNNTNWQTTNITFTATQNGTPLQITGIEPGMLLDAVSLTTKVAANVNADESLQFTNVMNVVADHISTSWSTNSLVSVLNSSNVTVQWSIMADSLYNTNNPQGFGSLLRYGSGALSFNHNLYANNYSANPYLGDNLSLDFVNNVIYNWGIHSGYSGTNDPLADPNGLTNRLNYACNYLIAGPDTAIYSTNAAQTNFAFWGGITNTWIFQTNNFIDSDTNRILNGANTGWGMFTNQFTEFGRPFPLPPVPTDEAFIAYERVLDFAGTSLFARDPVDADIVIGVRTQTGRIISTPPLLPKPMDWWPGEGNANDIVGANNGMLLNGAGFASGEVGQAFSFSGGADGTASPCVQIPYSPSLIVPNYSVETWIKPTAQPTNFDNQSFIFGQVNGYAQLVLLKGTSGVKVKFQFSNGFGGFPAAVSITEIPLGVFTHVAGTWDGTTIRLYINGVLNNSTTPGTTPASQGCDFFIGGFYAPIPGICNTVSQYFCGLIDEVSYYNLPLSAAEIKAIYNAGSAGKYGLLSPPPPLDSDQDGIPDYWEITLGTDPFMASNNNDRDGDGYSDLEEYINWLAAPHALTLTNTTVGVDLYRLAGDTGNLSFFVTNAVNGTVYLTNVLGSVTNTGPFSNTIAVFAPAMNYSGYASFDFFVTNNDTVAWFGPVPVSVMVSAVPVLNGGIVTLTNTIPYDDPTGTNGVDYYRYDVSTNAVGVKFQILNASGNVVLLAHYGLPLPSLGNFDYKTNAGFDTNASILVLPSSLPVPLTNGWWYLAVSNASGGLVDYTILVTELVAGTNTPPVLSTNLPSQILDEMTLLTVTNTATDANTNLTLSYTVTLSIDTNAMTVNGWPLNYVTTTPPPVISPSGIITWTPGEAQGPGVYIITTVVSDNGTPPLTATNSFGVTVNEVNTPPFWLPNVPSQTNYNISALTTLIVTNTATDSDIPPNPLTYQLLVSPAAANAAISTNGIIVWTPTMAQAPGFYTFTTIVTDTNAYALANQSLSATNVFTVFVSGVAAPFVFTEPAQSVTGTGAQLNGMATPNGLPTAAWYQWGTNTLYGNQTPPVSVGASFNVVYTTSPIGGLVANVPYHFRLVASNAVGVVYGFDQILDEADVVVWGANYAGQGKVPPGLSNVVAIAGAYDHSLALKNNGTAVGWGDNTFGQATVPAGLNNLVAVAGGEYYGMALKNSGTVAAWGASILGQTNVPAGLNNVVAIAGGTFSSLALKNNGAVVAWGASFLGLTNVPASLSNAVAIAGGSYHSLAIKNDGTVVVWGDNGDGQTNVPAGLTNVVAIAGGSYHSLALKYDGTVVAWGDNSAGQTSVPAGLSNVVAVAGGGFHSLALKNNGTVVAWGDNTAGQTSVPVSLSNVVAIASGYFHSLALTPPFNVNPTNPVVLNLTNGVPQTNSVLPGGITYYQVNVPANADFATNSLLYTVNGPLNIWFTTNSPPTITQPGDVDLMPNATNGISILSTTSVPTNIVPGATYYLGVQNTNSFTVNYGIEVDFHLTFGSITGPTITATNIGGFNGFLLQWEGPTNFQYEIQWTASLAPVVWNTVLNPVINVIVTTTNGHFSFFDDGSLTGGLGPMRFYRVLGNLNLGLLTPSLPTISTQTVAELTLLTVTNTVTNGIPPLIYSVSGPAGVAISSGGIITWTPTEWQGPGTYTITTIVTSSGLPRLSATNSFVVIVIEVNRAPYFLSTPANQTIGALSTLTVTNAAGDPDIPANPLTYTLLNPPAGMTIDTNGVITWTPTLAQALTTNLITTVVTDFNMDALVNQHLSATNTFTVRVPGIMPAFAFTQPAQSVTGTGAQLNGMATPNGPPTTAWFEWGTSAAYGNQTPPVNVGGSYSVVYVTSPITNLVMNQPYHFRLVVSNAIGVVHGFDQIFDEADVVAWGANYVGQTNVPAGLSNMVAVAGAYDHSLALKNDGTAVAWGDNTFGQATVPAGLNNVVAVAGGEYYSLALKNSGTVAAWGANILGQTNVPSGLNNVVTIAGGTYTSLALKNDGTVVAWGYIAGLTNVPAGLSNAVAIAGGGSHNLAIKNDGTIVAWGDNSAGQTNVPAGLTNVVAIAGGGYHSLALKYDGTVVAWGDNSAGQTNVPAGLSNVVAVAAGGYHSLALKNDGKVLAWGDNSTNQTSIPSGLSNGVAISSGYFHNLALASPFNVNVTNTPPFWVVTNLPPVALDELTTLSVTNIANDADLPPQTLTYTVTALVDTNAMIANSWPLNYATTNPPPIVNSNGVITWTPGEAQGPGVYIITVVVTDNGTPPLSVTNSFTMTVNEVNLPPVLPSPPDYTINRLTPLVVNNTATDPDIPANPLTYQLSGPVGATITNGVIAWTPTLVQGGTTNVFTTIVTDTNAFALANRSLSATNSFTVVVTMSINLTGGQPQTNTIAAGGIVYYAVTVPANADFATNRLLFATAPVNVWFDTNAPPTTNRLLLPDVTYPTGTNGTVVLSTNTPPPLVPGSAYYLGVQNTNSFPVTYALEVDFHVLISTNTIFISSITATNIGVTNGFRLAWFAPSNDLFQVQWTPSLAPTSWQTFTNIISYNTNAFTSPTNTQFNFFDDGSQTGGFGPERFYRLILLGSVSGLTNGVPQTNSVPSGGMDWFLINVPTNADFATNRLLSATGPVNVWFNQAVPPTGTNAGDHALLTDATNGSSVLSATSVPTNIVPGGFYWLGVQNTNGSAVTFGIEVDFHLLTSTNPPPTNTIVISSITATNIGVTNGFLLTWYAPTNDSFMVQWTTNLLPLVNWQTFTNIIAYTGSVTPTNGRFTFFDDGSQTGGVLGPQRFYRLILLGSVSGLTNGVPQTNSVSPGDTAFLLVTVPANAISASNLLISATGPVNVFFNQTHLPAGNTNAGDRLMLSATNAGTFLLASNSVPPLVPGASYYLGVQNPGTSNVTFAFQVVFGFATTNAVSNFGLIATNSGILLKWNGLTNYQYQVQWTTNLMPAVAWNTISNIVLTSTTGIFTFLDDGSLTGGFGPTKFYRLIIYPYLTPIPQTLSISSVTVTNITGTNDLVLRWSAPTNYHYGIQWTTNVSLPFTNWTVIPSPGLTLTNGVYTFVDNGQTGPPAGAKFFRLLENP